MPEPLNAYVYAGTGGIDYCTCTWSELRVFETPVLGSLHWWEKRVYADSSEYRSLSFPCGTHYSGHSLTTCVGNVQRTSGSRECASVELYQITVQC